MTRTVRVLLLPFTFGILLSACKRNSSVVTLSPEVRQFIEANSGGSGSCAQVPQLLEHISRLEKTVAELRGLKQGKKKMAEAREEVAETRRTQMQSMDKKLQAVRGAEAAKLKKKILLSCAEESLGPNKARTPKRE